MSAKTTGIVAYLTWIGLVIAAVAGDKDDPTAKVHLNNALVLLIFTIVLGIIPIAGWICEIAVLVFWIIGLVSAIKFEPKELPLIGKIHIIK